jgi:hypothetical protein
MSTLASEAKGKVGSQPTHIRFRIMRMRGSDGKLLHGRQHPDPTVPPARYLHIERVDGIDVLSGYLAPDTFTHVMRALVSIEYGTPNWCEKCHIAGHSYCRCEIASNE